MWAARSGSVAIAELLVSRGAMVNDEDEVSCVISISYPRQCDKEVENNFTHYHFINCM